MPVFHLPILYMEIKIPPPLSIPLGHLSLHSMSLHHFLFGVQKSQIATYHDSKHKGKMSALDSQVLGCISADFLHYIAVVKLFLLVSTAEICLGHCNSLFCLQKSDNVSICITYYAALFTSLL